MSIYRIDSSDKQVFINGSRLKGVQTCSVETPREFQELRQVGNLGVTDRILNSKQTSVLNLDFILCDSGQNDPFFDFETSGVLSVEKFDFSIKDLVGENILSGAYLNSYTLNAEIGALAKGSVTYDCDIYAFNNTGVLTMNDQSSDFFGVYQPRHMSVSSSFGDGLNSSGFCIQKFEISLQISRNAKSVLGNRYAFTRYPQLPVNGTASFSIIKNSITGIDFSQLVLDKGTLTFKLNDGFANEKQYIITDCSLEKIQESHDLDQNAMLDFSYVFSLTTGTVNVI